jgi:tetratricopeptide (TPR) repeat protein
MPRGFSDHLPAALICALLLIISHGPHSRAQSIAPVSGVEAAGWREDLRFMAREMPKRHKNLFHSMTREQFELAIKRLDERIPTLARHQIIVELARIVAQVGITRDGHTSLPLVPPPHEGAPFRIGFRQYPIKLYLYSDGFFVQAATSEHARLAGARVVRIGNVSVEQAFKAASEIVSRDNEMTLKDRVPELLTIPEVLHALGLIENMEKARFTFESGGAETALELSPIGDSRNIKWVEARESTSPTPLWLKDPHNNYWFEYLADSRTLYFQYNAVVNKDAGENLKAFFKRLFAFIEGHPVDRFIIDMRLNRGGNGFLSWPLIFGITCSDKINQRGKLFTIIGRRTFSAASMTAAWIGLHTNTTFVGEPTGGGVNVYGNHDSIVLPNSGIEVLVAPYYYQNTYPSDERLWIAPQITAELSSEDYRRNIDPALSAILKYQPVADSLRKALAEGGAQLMARRYLEFKNSPSTASINTEEDVNALGYELVGGGRLREAIEVFKLNVQSYPLSANAYDSLGDAYSRSGDKEQAIKAYEKALELNPASSQTAEKLRRLRSR